MDCLRSDRRPFRTSLPAAAVGVLALLVAVLAATTPAAQDTDAEPARGIDVAEINPGLDGPVPTRDLATPYGTLEYLYGKVADRALGRAAHALNLSFLPPERQAQRGADLAGKLAYILRRSDVVEWSSIPDTPFGRTADRTASSGALVARGGDGARDAPGIVSIAKLSAGGRPQPITLQRYRLPDGTGIWLFPPQVVEEIDALHAEHGPGWLADMLPVEARWQAIGRVVAWELGVLAAIVAGAGAVGWLVYGGLRLIARPRIDRQPMARSLARNAWLIGAIVGTLLVAVAATALYLDDGWLAPIREVSGFVVFVLGAWLSLRIVSGIVLTVSSRVAYADPESDRAARTLHTDIAVARRILMIVLLAIALSLVLTVFDVLPNVGLSLLASTGVLGVLIAFATRPLLGNMALAAEVAATKPLAIGDVVTVEGRWCRVEDLTFSYAVLRTWANTRLILPYTRLLSEPFESWSRHDETILRCVVLHVDYRTDVAAVREEFHRLVEGDERWTGDTAWLVVAELGEDTVRLEGWLSGTDSYSSWTLHNDVRERLLAFLQSRAATTLPRSRHLVDPMPSAPPSQGPGRVHEGSPARPSDRVERPRYEDNPPPALKDQDGDAVEDERGSGEGGGGDGT